VKPAFADFTLKCIVPVLDLSLTDITFINLALFVSFDLDFAGFFDSLADFFNSLADPLLDIAILNFPRFTIVLGLY